MNSEKLAFKLAECALSKKAEDIKILDLRGITTIADFFVICTAHSEPQVKAVADAVLIGAKSEGETIWHKEGMNMRSWVLLDYVDVVVHIFLRDTRNFYSLEKLWGDAKITEVNDEPVKPKAKKVSSAKPKAKVKSISKPKSPAKRRTTLKPRSKK